MPIRFLLHLKLQQKNLPLTWLAAETRMSVPTLRRLKNERSASIKIEALNELCEVLCCEPSELFEFVPIPSTRRQWKAKRDRDKSILREKLNTYHIPDYSKPLEDD